MDSEPGPGWADAVSKILKMGTMKPKKNKILSKAKIDLDRSKDKNTGEPSQTTKTKKKTKKERPEFLTKRLKADADHLSSLEKDLKAIATGGVVQLFNAVRAVNPNVDKSGKKKKKKKKRKMR